MLAGLFVRIHVGVYSNDGISCLDNRLWCDAVLLVVLELHGAAALGLVDGALHRIGDFVGIHNHLSVKVSCRATCRLGQGAMRAQEAFFVGIEDGNERHLGQVKALTQQVHAHEHVNHAQAQVVDNLDAVHGLHVAVHVGALDIDFRQVVVQFLGHALGEGGHEHALAILYAQLYLVDEVINLAQRGANGNLGVKQAGGAYNLLGDNAFAALELIVGRGGAHVDGLVGQCLKLGECQRPVVTGSIEAEAIVHEGVFA